MNNVINIKILSGIPGCGKSTWSMNYVIENRNIMRINRDDLRHILVEDVSTDGNDHLINKVKNSIIRIAIESNRNIILDDTHCYKDYLISLIDFIRKLSIELEKNIEIEILDFDIPIDICVERNKLRGNGLSTSAIYHMISQKKEINFHELDIDKYTKIS
jgi:predicted kinase